VQQADLLVNLLFALKIAHLLIDLRLDCIRQAAVLSGGKRRELRTHLRAAGELDTRPRPQELRVVSLAHFTFSHSEGLFGRLSKKGSEGQEQAPFGPNLGMLTGMLIEEPAFVIARRAYLVKNINTLLGEFEQVVWHSGLYFKHPPVGGYTIPQTRAEGTPGLGIGIYSIRYPLGSTVSWDRPHTSS